MNAMPSIDALEKSHTFPGSYVFKVIGKADHEFVARVVAAVREQLLLETDPAYQIREAVGGRHLSITMEPIVHSPEQILAIYKRLGKLAGVVMLF